MKKPEICSNENKKHSDIYSGFSREIETNNKLYN